MDASVANIRAENLTLTQQNLSLRQQITALRNDRLDLQYKLVETIGAKESFKIEVIKLITQAQNTFERLKTFIEHTTSTPPPSLLSGTEKLLRRQIVGGNHGILRQIPIQKDKQQIPVAAQQPPPPALAPAPQPTPPPQSTSVQNENDDMHFIDEKILKLNTILKKYERDIKKDIKKENQDVAATTTTNPTTTAATLTKQATKVGNENRRYSKRLQSNVSNCPVEKHHNDNKENLEMVCAFKDITNGAPMRLTGAAPPSHARGSKDENKLNTTPKSRGKKRKVII